MSTRTSKQGYCGVNRVAQPEQQWIRRAKEDARRTTVGERAQAHHITTVHSASIVVVIFSRLRVSLVDSFSHRPSSFHHRRNNLHKKYAYVRTSKRKRKKKYYVKNVSNAILRASFPGVSISFYFI